MDGERARERETEVESEDPYSDNTLKIPVEAVDILEDIFHSLFSRLIH